jgi:hypothetical protein
LGDAEGALSVSLLDRDGDYLGNDRRVVGDVVHVTEHELKSALAGRQLKHGFGLAAAEMNMVLVGRKRVFKLIGAIFALAQRRAIDQEAMMAGIVLLGTGWCHAHAVKLAAERLTSVLDSLAVDVEDDISLRISSDIQHAQSE